MSATAWLYWRVETAVLWRFQTQSAVFDIVFLQPLESVGREASLVDVMFLDVLNGVQTYAVWGQAVVLVSLLCYAFIDMTNCESL